MSNDLAANVRRTCTAALAVGMLAATGVGAQSRAVAISAAFANHTCVITSERSVRCWGDNTSGQLGNNDYAPSPVPVDVQGLPGPVAAIATGNANTCALTMDGALWCWGTNLSGRLGNASIPESGSPVAVPVDGLGQDVVSFGVGEAHACAVVAGGAVRCWGFNGGGQIGTGDTLDVSSPTAVAGLPAVRQIAPGLDHTCALTAAGAILCWGFNGFGSFGDGTTNDSFAPTPGPFAAGVQSLASGQFHTCAIRSGGTLWCWGLNLYGAVGSAVPQQIEASAVRVGGFHQPVLAVATGSLSTCALTTGKDQCWGRNAFGEVGDGTAIDRFTPVAVKRLPGSALAISGGAEHACAIMVDGGVRCWGWNIRGQLGNGRFDDSFAPVHVVGFGVD
jgi:alpha-tubulin suppressor-like RCC1 family protein